jgi:hypothetical protein
MKDIKRKEIKTEIACVCTKHGTPTCLALIFGKDSRHNTLYLTVDDAVEMADSLLRYAGYIKNPNDAIIRKFRTIMTSNGKG